jgi:hypothetical protein
MSGKKFSIANLVRLEQRSFHYSGDRQSTSDSRFRNRVELKLAINEPNLATDGVWYLTGDAEWFVPLEDNEASERFATKFRLRAGIGYRYSYKWRFEIRAIRDTARQTLLGDIDVDALMLDLRVKWFF